MKQSEVEKGATWDPLASQYCRMKSRVEAVASWINQINFRSLTPSINKYCNINVVIREIQILDGKKEAVHKDCLHKKAKQLQIQAGKDRPIGQ